MPEGDFLRGPRAAVERAIDQARPRLAQMRTAMEAASAELLYDAPASRVADNLLLRWREQCAA